MILIFEDNMDIASVLKRMLSHMFHEASVITCNCEDAENLVLAGEVELVLSDLNIEGHKGQGLDLIRTIRRIRPHTSPPIIVYTGLNSTDSTFAEAERFSDEIFEKSDITLHQLCKEVYRLLKLRQK
ncbi:MAG: response regulator [Victivallales bacterium]